MKIKMKCLASLVHAALGESTNIEIPDGFTTKELLDIANRNHMDVMLLSQYIRFDDGKNSSINEIRNRIKISLFRTLTQIKELECLENAFEEAGVRNQPMKGSVLKFIYPKPTIREMSDIDILVHHDDMPKAKNILIKLGYKIYAEEMHHHDIYTKSPFMVVEAHHAMYDKEVDLNQYEYFKNMSRAVLREGHNYTYDFTKEDFYVYMMSHMAKHFYQMGCGIRNLVDVYVYRNYYQDQLDEEYIEKELDKCGILTFTRHIEKLTRIWLCGEECTEFYENLFTYMVDSGIYGKDENGIWNEFAKEEGESRAHYDRKLKRFYYFPPYTYMAKYYPWVSGKKALLPLAWGVRAIVGICKKRGTHKMEMISHIDTSDIKTIQSIYSAMQFDFHK